MDNKKYLPYVILNVGGQEYKLRISASAAIDAEKKLNTTLARAWSKIDSVEIQVTILWAALQRYHHGASFDEAVDIYDNYIDENGNIENLIDVFMEVYRCSGFMKREEKPIASN